MHRTWHKKQLTSIPLPMQSLNYIAPIDHKTVYESNLSHVKVNQEKRGKEGHIGSKPRYHLN